MRNKINKDNKINEVNKKWWGKSMEWLPEKTMIGRFVIVEQRQGKYHTTEVNSREIEAVNGNGKFVIAELPLLVSRGYGEEDLEFRIAFQHFVTRDSMLVFAMVHDFEGYSAVDLGLKLENGQAVRFGEKVAESKGRLTVIHGNNNLQKLFVWDLSLIKRLQLVSG